MAWEKRQGGRLYYTRSRKVGGRVVREYVGCGIVGELAAAYDAAKRESRRRRAAVLAAVRTQLDTCDADSDEFSRAVRVLTRSTLIVAGYHQHCRGEWRRTRV